MIGRRDLWSPRQRGLALLVKRTIDVVGAVALLVLLAPLLVAVAVAVRFDSPGPALYRATRIGRHGEPFTVLKFRSMRTDADDAPHAAYVAALLTANDHAPQNANGLYKLTDDPRVTRIGRVLRRLSIDELPQLLNVLAGDMSLVGPRPEVPYALEHYKSWHWRRFAVLPGLTGLWQVSGRAELTAQDMLRLDVAYADTWSLRLDLRILARTVPAVLRTVGSA